MSFSNQLVSADVQQVADLASLDSPAQDFPHAIIFYLQRASAGIFPISVLGVEDFHTFRARTYPAASEVEFLPPAIPLIEKKNSCSAIKRPCCRLQKTFFKRA
jgi:hypothetical protein